MADAKAAGVTAFDGGKQAKAKIIETDNSLMLMIVAYPDTPVVREIAGWAGTATGDNEDYIRIRQWLNASY
jgi:hypothetical protein